MNKIILLAIIVAVSLCMFVVFTKQEKTLKIGQQAPDFSLPDQSGTLRALKDFAGTYVVIYFYPKDNTSGCTKQACLLRDWFSEYKKNNITVLGISYDSVEAHRVFAEQHHLPFYLLSDASHDVAKRYGAKRWLIPIPYRNTYVVTPNGKVCAILENVDIAKHAEQILGIIDQHKKSIPSSTHVTSPHEQQTIAYYDQHPLDWVARRGDTKNNQSYLQEQLNAFHERLPNGRVLEIGAGLGTEAAELIKFGYEYVGTDASKGLLDVARKNNPGATFLHTSVYDLVFDSPFDGFWAAAILLHMPKQRIDEALQAIKRCLKPGAIGFISLKEGTGESEDAQTGRWFAYYTSDEFEAILKRNGFVVQHHQKRTQAHNTWLEFFVKLKD